ncbi:MAG: homoserine kinase [Actinomycetota bacterium]|nr:MAG: homoserine kinase [Actinomycetota bacterium]
MIARVPASSANLGPGFDTLALALSLYLEVEAEESDRFQVSAFGEGSELEINDEHLGARVARKVLGHSRVHLTIRSQIPLGRGLGSSAAFVSACSAALGAEDPFLVAAGFDGHPENAAASVFGGFVTATAINSKFVSRGLDVDPDLAAVAVIPYKELATKTARGVLPKMVSLEDATFNLGRMGLLVSGLGDLGTLVAEATHDRLHQSYRSALFPESAEILSALTTAGAIASCWSGAGPTMIGFCRSSRAPEVSKTLEQLLNGSEVSFRIENLNVDYHGLRLAKSYGPDFQPLEVASL